MSPRLDPRDVGYRLGRELQGSSEPGKMTGEFAVLELVNTDQLDRAMAAVSAPSLRPDFAAAVRAEIDRLQDQSTSFVRRNVDIPKAVWDRYAQRARIEHRRTRSLIAEALIAHDERIERSKAGEVPGARALEELLREQREISTRLARQVERLEKSGHAQPDAGVPVRGIEELKEHARLHGMALAAILSVLNDRGWVRKNLADRLRKERWLPE